MVVSRPNQNYGYAEAMVPQIFKFFEQSITTHVYSFPNFILETFLALLICVLYVLLHVDIARVTNNMNVLNRGSIYSKIRGSISNISVLNNISQLTAKSNNPSHTLQNPSMQPNISDSERRRFAEQLANLSPKEFVRLDRRRQLNKKFFGNNITSLTTLCKNVVTNRYSPKSLKQQIEQARENLLCNSASPKSRQLQFRAEGMTDSLITLLENVVTNSSIQNPLPFNGDIANLALDASDLSCDSLDVVKELDEFKLSDPNSPYQLALDDNTSCGTETNIHNADVLSEISSETGISCENIASPNRLS